MNKYESFYNSKIPEASNDHQEVSKLMRINVDILKQEITEHVDKEIKRFRDSVESIKNK